MKRIKFEIFTFLVIFVLCCSFHNKNWQQIVFHCGGLALCISCITHLIIISYWDYLSVRLAKHLLDNENLNEKDKTFCQSVSNSLSNNYDTYSKVEKLLNTYKSSRFVDDTMIPVKAIVQTLVLVVSIYLWILILYVF